MLAICAPVTNPTLASAGRAEHLEQPRRGDLLDDGRGRRQDIRSAFWSHADVSQSAATAAGSAPPMTKPK